MRLISDIRKQKIYTIYILYNSKHQTLINI